VGKVAVEKREQGFTLVELMIALLVLAVVVAALAPAFYGELKATSASNFRSAANGLAVGAIEEMRAFPFYEIGYNQTDYSTAGTTALSCVSPTNSYQAGGAAPSWNSSAGLEPVQLSSGSALDNVNNNLLTSQTISNVTFSTTRCVYWVGSSTGNTAAYKLTWVGVSWTVAGVPWHVSQTSAIYPGGEGKYTAGHNNATPGAQNCANQGIIPFAVQNLAAAVDSTSPTTTVDLTWSEGSDSSVVMPVQYQVNYNSTTSTGPWVPFSQTGLPSQNVDGLTPGVTYWFQVLEVSCDGKLGPATVVSQATNNASQTCSATNFTVTPKSAQIGSSDHLSGISSFTVSVQITSGCNNVAAYYSPKNDGTYVSDSAPSGPGTVTWSTSASKWAAGTVTFHLYVGGTDTGDTAQVTIICGAKSC
jgi:prepilin-type N-terminal cleavage/methylation domain-containing protein